MTQKFHSDSYLLKRNKNTWPHQELYTQIVIDISCLQTENNLYVHEHVNGWTEKFVWVLLSNKTKTLNYNPCKNTNLKSILGKQSQI